VRNMQTHNLPAALAILVDTAVVRCSGRQDSALTCLASLLSSGNRLQALEHAVVDRACLR